MIHQKINNLERSVNNMNYSTQNIMYRAPVTHPVIPQPAQAATTTKLLSAST